MYRSLTRNMFIQHTPAYTFVMVWSHKVRKFGFQRSASLGTWRVAVPFLTVCVERSRA